MCVEKSFRNSCRLGNNGIESFKSHDLFHNKHLEVSTYKLSSEKRRKRIKLGFCEDEL